MASERDRKIAIFTMAKNLLRLQDEVISEKHMQIDKVVARNALLDVLGAVRILEMRDPGDLGLGLDPVSAIAMNITDRGTFKSQRVEDTIFLLRKVS